MKYGIEDHRRGGPVLPAYAADVEPHGQVEHIVDLVRRHQPRSGRIEGLRRLALGPLPAAFDLEGPFADVVDHGESGDGGVGLLDRVEIAGPAADDDAQLDLPVGFRRAARDADVVVRADQRVRRLGEQDRLIRDRRPGLGGVVAVVQADAQDLVRPGDRGADPLIGECRQLSRRHPLADDAAQARDPVAAEERLVEVADHIGDVDVVGVVDPDDRLLRTGRTDTHEVHGELLGSSG